MCDSESVPAPAGSIDREEFGMLLNEPLDLLLGEVEGCVVLGVPLAVHGRFEVTCVSMRARTCVAGPMLATRARSGKRPPDDHSNARPAVLRPLFLARASNYVDLLE